MSLRTELLADAPLVLWGLGETAGAAANVGSLGAAMNGAYFGSPTRGAAALDVGGDGAVDLNFVDAYVSSAGTVNLPGSYTVFFGMKRAGSEGAAYYYHVQLGTGMSDYGPFIYTVGLGGGFYIKILHGAAFFDTFTLDPPISYGATHWIHLVYDSPAQQFRLYVDGVIVKTFNPSPAPPPVISKPLTVGRVLGADAFARGPHDEVAIFDAALPLPRIQAQVAAATTPPADTTPPTVTLDAPLAGATVAGAVVLAATAADAPPGAVAGVQFFVDGNPIGGEDATAPYSISWDSTTVADGAHTISCRARDAANNFSALPNPSAAIIVQNVVAPIAPLGVVATPGDTMATVSWNPAAGAAGYRIFRAGAPGGPYTLVGTK